MNASPGKSQPLLIVGPSPHIHAPGSVRTIMLDVLIALLPALVASCAIFGLRALALVSTCVASCVLTEHLCRRAMRRPDTTGDLSAVVTGVLLAFNLPPTLPFWVAVLGSVFAIAIAKQVFGGLGYNPFNPALVARAFLLVSFTGAMTTWSATAAFDPSAVADAVTTATPLGIAKAAMRSGLPPPITMDAPMIWRFATGNINGCLGETCSIALLLGACYLVFRRVITLHTPVAYLGTVAVLAAALRVASPATAMPVSFHLLSGGLMLGALFMATDMVTTPSTEKGKVIFGIGCGILTIVIRSARGGAYPEGVSFAILIMNAFTPLIDRITPHRVFGRGMKPKAKKEEARRKA